MSVTNAHDEFSEGIRHFICLKSTFHDFDTTNSIEVLFKHAKFITSNQNSTTDTDFSASEEKSLVERAKK